LTAQDGRSGANSRTQRGGKRKETTASKIVHGLGANPLGTRGLGELGIGGVIDNG
jgi:hypothetical protein